MLIERQSRQVLQYLLDAQHLVTKSLSRVDSDSMQIMHKSFDWTSSELSSSITTKSGNGTVFNNSRSVYSLHDAHLDCRYSDIASSESSRHFDNKYSLGRFNPVIFFYSFRVFVKI